MSENSESSTRSGDWLTVSQAAAALGISERQARRDAKRLKADDRRDAGHKSQSVGHMAGHDAGHKSGSRPALVRLQALRDVRENAVSRAKFPTPDIQTDTAPDIMPDTIAPNAGHDAGHMTGALLSQLQSENAFLRAQVEAANRQAAEATAALREYLKMQAKALPDGQSSTRNATAISSTEAPQTAQNVVVNKEPQPIKNGARGTSLRDLQTILRTLFSLR